VTTEHLIAHYGYLALLFGTFLEGETILVVAGFAAHQGYLKLGWVILAAFIGSLSGDQFYFFVGRLKGRAFVERRPGWQTQVKKVERLLDRYGTWILVGFRFMYGLRTVTPFVIGLSGFSSSRFVVLNAIGALVWSILVGSLGFLFGAALEAVLEDLKKFEHWIVLGLLAVGTTVWLIHFWRKKRIGRRTSDNRLST
jgi:membrane protein DedA with SNARE-associated domain